MQNGEGRREGRGGGVEGWWRGGGLDGLGRAYTQCFQGSRIICAFWLDHPHQGNGESCCSASYAEVKVHFRCMGAGSPDMIIIIFSQMYYAFRAYLKIVMVRL